MGGRLLASQLEHSHLNSLFSTLLDQMPDGFAVLSPQPSSASHERAEFDVLLTNSALTDMLGMTDPPAGTLTDLCALGMQDGVHELCTQAMVAQSAISATFFGTSASGDQHSYVLKAFPAGAEIGLLWQDVTEQQALTDRLHKLIFLLADSQTVAHIGAFEWIPSNKDGLTVTEEFSRILGLDPKQPPRTLEHVLATLVRADATRLREMMHKAIAAQASVDMRFRVPHSTSDDSACRIQGRVGRAPHGHASLIGTLQDTTEDQRLNDKLNRAQRVQTLGIMAAGLAHDFNNLLAVAALTTDILRRHLDEHDWEDASTTLTSVRSTLLRATDLTGRLLTLTGDTRRTVRPIQLDELVQEMRPLLAAAVGGQHTVACDVRSRPRVLADRTQLEQVILNLVLNGRDAMPDGGTIEITLDTAEANAPELLRWHSKLLEETDWAVLTVTDSGTGMDSNTLQHMYDPFFTTKSGTKGTGLGVPVVLGIVHESNGHLEITSELGSGTQAVVSLPCTVLEITPSATDDARSEDVRVSTARILLVESEAEVRELTHRTLDALGYRVQSVAGASEARRLLRHERFDVVVTSLLLPREDGASLADSILADLPDTKVLIISGATPPAISIDNQRCAFQSKPFTSATLSRSLERLLNGDSDL